MTKARTTTSQYNAGNTQAGKNMARTTGAGAWPERTKITVALTKDETITAVAELIAGLQVPVSLCQTTTQRLEILGTAYEPWQKLFNGLNSFGWTNAEKLEEKLREVLG